MQLGLEERVCVVTGSTEGIGEAAARMLAEEGARVVTCARRESAPGVGEALHVALDLSVPSAPGELINAAEQAFGRVECLVNNVGVAYQTSFEGLSDEDWASMWELNVMSYVRAIKAVLPGMRESGSGRTSSCITPCGVARSVILDVWRCDTP